MDIIIILGSVTQRNCSSAAHLTTSKPLGLRDALRSLGYNSAWVITGALNMGFSSFNDFTFLGLTN